MDRNKIIEIFDKIVLIVVVLIFAIVLIAGFLGQKTIFGFTIDYAYVACLLLGTITLHLLLSVFGSFGHKQIEQKIEISVVEIVNLLGVVDNRIGNSVGEIVESLGGIERKTFNSILEVDDYVATRIQEAKLSVQDLNWQDFREATLSDSQLNREITDDKIDASIKEFCIRARTKEEKKKSIYEEIFTFPASNKINIQKLKSHIEYGEIYSCSYYETLGQNKKFPKLQFVIIDNEEVIFVSSEYKENFCSIKDRRIVNICSNYFMQARSLSMMIKEKNQKADLKVIDKIVRKHDKKRKPKRN